MRYDDRGVPHIRAENETDLYRALGYVHAQDRLFQMEIMRRLARGELAEVLGPKVLDTDKLFRSLRIRERAATLCGQLDHESAHWKALQAYLDGINQYQDSHASPMEFDVLGIPKRPFTAEDTISVAGYMAYSFAAAFRTEPLLTYVRDQLGSDYLKVFDLDWQPKGVLAINLAASDWQDPRRPRLPERAGPGRQRPAAVRRQQRLGHHRQPHQKRQAVAGRRPAHPFLGAAVWYEAQLSAPGFELYGYHHALVPVAFLGHNLDFGWSLTMFQNDDLDLIAEKLNPDNPNQVWYHDQWVDMTSSEQQIAVKGQAPVTLMLRQSPHGPIINDVLGDNAGKTPIAMWWAFLDTQNPILEGFYQLNRADTLAKARARRPRFGAGAEHRVGQRQGRYRLVGGGAVADSAGRRQPRVYPRRQHRPGRQAGLLPVQRQPPGRKPGARLRRVGQRPAGVAHRHGDPRLLQPRRPWPAVERAIERQKREVGREQQPGCNWAPPPPSAHACWRRCCRCCVRWSRTRHN